MVSEWARLSLCCSTLVSDTLHYTLGLKPRGMSQIQKFFHDDLTLPKSSKECWLEWDLNSHLWDADPPLYLLSYRVHREWRRVLIHFKCTRYSRDNLTLIHEKMCSVSILFQNHAQRYTWTETSMIIWHCRSQLKSVDSGGIWSRTFGIPVRHSTCWAIESTGIGGEFYPTKVHFCSCISLRMILK